MTKTKTQKSELRERLDAAYAAKDAYLRSADRTDYAAFERECTRHSRIIGDLRSAIANAEGAERQAAMTPEELAESLSRAAENDARFEWLVDNVSVRAAESFRNG